MIRPNSRNSWVLLLVLLLAAGTGLGVRASRLAEAPQPASATETESEGQREGRMRWWREAKFGMFIHWGVYAVPAGIRKGQPVPGAGEWIMNRGKIPVAEYRQFARQFNPVKYDPEAWAALAQEAGMRYIVIT